MAFTNFKNITGINLTMKIQAYDTIIVLSHGNAGNLPTEEGRQRVGKGIELYRNHSGYTITMSGKNGHNIPQGITHAESMKRYATSMGVPGEIIIKEENSVDTVGQAVFAKKDIILPRNWEKLVVVSSDYHMERVKIIFDFVFGRDFGKGYYYSESMEDIPPLAEKEKKSLEAFFHTFRDIKSGDDKSIIERLYSEHPLYKKL